MGWILFGMAAAVGFIYGPWLGAWFTVKDDFTFILSGMRVSLDGLWANFGRYGCGYFVFRPVVVGGFAMLHAVFGIDPLGYRAVVLLTHLFNAALVGGMVGARSGRYSGILAGTLFALHPLHTESQFWIACWPNALGTTGMLLALRAATRWSEPWATAGAMAGYSLSLYSFPLAIWFPVALLVYEYAAGRPRKVVWVRFVGLLIILAIWTAGERLGGGLRMGGISLFKGGTSWTELLLRNLFTLPARLFFPLPEDGALDWLRAGGGWNPGAVLRLLLLPAGWAIGMWWWRAGGREGRALADWTIVMAAPLATRYWIEDRHLYAAAAGGALGMAWAAGQAWERWPRARAFVAGACLLWVGVAAAEQSRAGLAYLRAGEMGRDVLLSLAPRCGRGEVLVLSGLPSSQDGVYLFRSPRQMEHALAVLRPGCRCRFIYVVGEGAAGRGSVHLRWWQGSLVPADRMPRRGA